MSEAFTLSWRYLSGRKLRPLLTTLAIVFGVMVVYGFNLVMPAMEEGFKANLMAASGNVDLSVTNLVGDVFPQDVIQRLDGLDGVRVVSPVLDRTINLPADFVDHDPATADKITALNLVGFEPQSASQVHAFVITAGRQLATGDQNSLLISQTFAEEAKLQPGERLTLPGFGGLFELKVLGIYSDQLSLGNEEAYLPLSTMQTLLGETGKINLIEINFNQVTEQERAALSQQVQVRLGDGFKLGALDSGSEMMTNLQVGNLIFNMLGVLALLMGGFIIFNTFRTLVAERRRDIVMLRAVGAQRRLIVWVILFEGLIQGLIGSVIGILLGQLLGGFVVNLTGQVFNRFMNMQIRVPGFSWVNVLIGLALGLGITLLAGLIPARRASHITPIEALRPQVGQIKTRKLLTVWFLLGLAALAGAIVALLTQKAELVGLGSLLLIVALIILAPALVYPLALALSRFYTLLFPRSQAAEMAAGNLARQPARTAVTASASMIAFAILIAAASVVESATVGFEVVLRRSLGSDYILLPASVALWGNDVGASPQLAASLRQIPGVETVSPLRYAPSKAGELAVNVLGIDPLDYEKVSGLTFKNGDAAEIYQTLQKPGTLIANPILATSLGLKEGDTLELASPKGIKSYQVIALGTDYLNAKLATAYLSIPNLEADFERKADVLLQIGLTQDANRESVAAAIKSMLASYPQFKLISGQQYVEENMSLLKVATIGMYVLMLFLAIPSLLGMLNSLAIGVIERTREIGMLRAVGATVRQVRVIISVEGVILSIIGTVIGILAELYLGYTGTITMQVMGYPIAYVFPGLVVIVNLLVGIAFGLIASAVPARQASRVNIVEALRYE